MLRAVGNATPGGGKSRSSGRGGGQGQGRAGSPGGTVSALLHFDGAAGGTVFTDSTGLNTWTRGGNSPPTTNTASPKFGTAEVEFTGNGLSTWGYLSTPYNAAHWNLSGDWTAECWLWPQNIASYTQIVFVFWDATSTAAPIYVVSNTDGTIRVYHSSNGSTYDVNNVSTGTWTNGSWQAFALVKHGTNLYSFKNGVKTTLSTSVGSTYTTGSPKFRFGNATEASRSGDSAFRIDEFRFTSGVALYTDNYTPATSAFTYP